MKTTDLSAIAPTTSRLISMAALRAKLGGDPPPDPSTVYRLVQQGVLPKPVKIGARMSRWIETEVDQAIQKRADARGRKAPPRRDA